MALKLATNNPYDGVAQDCYYKIVEINTNWLEKSSHVVMLGYLDQTARQELRQPIVSKVYDWSGDEFPFTLEALDLEGNNQIKIAYAKIKESKLDEDGNETNEFASAIDVL